MSEPIETKVIPWWPRIPASEMKRLNDSLLLGGSRVIVTKPRALRPTTYQSMEVVPLCGVPASLVVELALQEVKRG